MVDGADGAGNDRRVVAEQQSAECGDERKSTHQRGIQLGLGNPL